MNEAILALAEALEDYDIKITSTLCGCGFRIESTAGDIDLDRTEITSEILLEELKNEM